MIVHSIQFVPAKAVEASPAVAERAGGGPALERAGLLTKAGRLRRELAVWVKAGAPRVPREIRKARLEACKACAYYNAAGNLGLGECRHPGCGCTRAKTALGTSKCPKVPPAWGPWTPPSAV